MIAARNWLTRGGGANGGYVERRGDSFRASPLAIEKFGLRVGESAVQHVVPETSSQEGEAA